jgi:hypothetical protein
VVTKSAVQPTEGGVMSRLFADGDSVGGRAGPVGHMSAMATTVEAGPMTRGQMSAQSRQEVSTFTSTAVLPKTNRVYEKEWESFKAFVKKETGSDDPFLTKCTKDEKATLVALMMMRHESGKPGKAATSFTAAVRQMYARMIFPHNHSEGVVRVEAERAPSFERQRTGSYSQAAHM